MTEIHASPAPHPKRAPLHPDINDQMIERLVRHFYSRIREDRTLGPIFAAAIPADWEPHLQTMMSFWSSVMMMSGRYKGQPVPKHLALKTVRPEHFETWLRLFRESTQEICSAEVAPLFVERAERIAESLKLAMYGVPEIRTPGT